MHLAPIDLYRLLVSRPAGLRHSEHAIARIAQRLLKQLAAEAGVLGYALGDKASDPTRPSGQMALRFYVSRKQPASRVACLIPPVIRLVGMDAPVLTDVMATPIASAACAPGSEIYRAETPSNAGTVACGVYSRSNPAKQFLLAPWHVVAGENARTHDPIASNAGLIGTLARSQSLSYQPSPDLIKIQSFDGALVRPKSCQATAELLAGRVIPGVRSTPLRIGERLSAFGATSANWRTGKVLATAETVPVRFSRTPARWITFAHLIRCQGLSSKGDSGGPVLDDDGLLVGYVIADDASKSQAATTSWIQPIGRALNEYGVDVLTQAAAFHSDSGGVDLGLTIDTLARTLWGEARGEPELGRLGVAWVVLNRLHHKPARFGRSIAEVCRKPKQFSCWNPGDPNLPKLLTVEGSDRVFAACLELARQCASGTQPPDPTGGADHYHRFDVSPPWSRGRTPSARIGNHLFFNNIT